MLRGNLCQDIISSEQGGVQRYGTTAVDVLVIGY